jgi:hypothetical protein
MRLLIQVTFVSGALALIGGTIGVIVFMSGWAGVVVGLQGLKALDSLGSSVLTGFSDRLHQYPWNRRRLRPLHCRRPSVVVSTHNWAHANLRGNRSARGDGGAGCAVSGDHARHRQDSWPLSRSVSSACWAHS